MTYSKHWARRGDASRANKSKNLFYYYYITFYVGGIPIPENKKKMDSRFFSFRGSGIIQQTGTAVPLNDGTVEEKKAEEKIFKPSDEVIDFSAAGTEDKEVVQNVVDLADAKVMDRDHEGIMEFDQEGSKHSKKKKPKMKRVTTIRDYVKKIDEKEEASMDYISIDEDEPPKRVFDEDGDPDNNVKPKGELEEDGDEEELPELGFIPIDDDDEPDGSSRPSSPASQRDAGRNGGASSSVQQAVADDDETDDRPEEEDGVVMPKHDSKEPAASGDEKLESIGCPHCGETIVIPSSRRPITLKCPACKQKGTLRI